MKKQLLVFVSIGMALTVRAQQQEHFPYRVPMGNRPSVRVIPPSKSPLTIPRRPGFRQLLPDGTWLMRSPSYHMPVITGMDLTGPMPNPAYPKTKPISIYLLQNRIPGSMPNAAPFLFPYQ